MPLESDDFVFRKVNWPLPLRRGIWMGFRLRAKLPLSVTNLTVDAPLSNHSFYFIGISDIELEWYRFQIIRSNIFTTTVANAPKVEQAFLPLRRRLNGPRSDICPEWNLRPEWNVLVFTWLSSSRVSSRGENFSGPCISLTRKIVLIFTRKIWNILIKLASPTLYKMNASLFTKTEMTFIDVQSKFLNLLLLQRSNQM